MIPEKKNIHVMNPEQITEPVNEPQIRGFQMKKAPQAKITTADTTAFVSNASNSVADSGIVTLNNMRTRIAELETVLINLGLLKQN